MKRTNDASPMHAKADAVFASLVLPLLCFCVWSNDEALYEAIRVDQMGGIFGM